MLFYLQSRISPLPLSPSSPCPSLAQPSPPSEVLVCAWLLPQQIVLRSICVTCSFYKIPNDIPLCDYATLFSTWVVSNSGVLGVKLSWTSSHSCSRGHIHSFLWIYAWPLKMLKGVQSGYVSINMWYYQSVNSVVCRPGGSNLALPLVGSALHSCRPRPVSLSKTLLSFVPSQLLFWIWKTLLGENWLQVLRSPLLYLEVDSFLSLPDKHLCQELYGSVTPKLIEQSAWILAH